MTTSAGFHFASNTLRPFHGLPLQVASLATQPGVSF
jgi:hypothetical protein